MENNKIWWIIGIVIVIFVIANSQNSRGNNKYDFLDKYKDVKAYTDFKKGNAETVVDYMLSKCGYQINANKVENRQCMIRDLKGGDTVDDCMIVTGISSEEYEINKKITHCYITVDYNDEEVAG